MEGERSFTRRSTNTTNNPTSRATTTQTTTRADCANQPMSSPIHLRKPRVSSFGGEGSSVRTHFRVRTDFSGARLGSAFTLSMACLISSRVGACAATTIGSPASSNASVRTLSLERTTQFLLDVPRFELRATVQIHCKARSHVERLEKQNGDHVGAGDRELDGAEVCVRERAGGSRCEPEYQRAQRHHQYGFSHTERRGHQSGRSGATASNLAHALARGQKPKSLELIHRLRK